MPTRYRGTQDEVRALSALINLVRATEALVTVWQHDLAGSRLTKSQFGILEVLLHLGPICQGELAGKLLRSCGSMTSVVEGLEKKGLVERRRDGSDKRFVTVGLTAKGEKLIGDLFPPHAKKVTEYFSVLTAPEQDKLRRLCRKLGTAIARG